MALKWESYFNPLYEKGPTNRKPMQGYPVTREIASVLSKNGALGCVWLVEWVEGWTLEAAGEDTGRAWKSPDKMFVSEQEAKDAAEKLWKSV